MGSEKVDVFFTWLFCGWRLRNFASIEERMETSFFFNKEESITDAQWDWSVYLQNWVVLGSFMWVFIDQSHWAFGYFGAGFCTCFFFLDVFDQDFLHVWDVGPKVAFKSWWSQWWKYPLLFISGNGERNRTLGICVFFWWWLTCWFIGII